MRLGLSLPQFGAPSDPARVGEFARAAEAMGYASLWVGDRLLTPTRPRSAYPGEPQPYPPEFTHATDPLVLWAAAAATTSTIRLGSSTLNAPWYNPVLLARALTTIDALSGGRLEVGFGIGWMRDEYDAAGVAWSGRAARLDETLDFLRAWWTQNPVEFHGRFVEVPESVVDLRPAQVGGPPVLLGGFTPAALERVGRRADGYLAVVGLPEEYQQQLWDTARRSAEGAGRDPEALRRVLRINAYDAAPDALESAVLAAGADEGDTVLVDLGYGTKTVDEALDAAQALASRVDTS